MIGRPREFDRDEVLDKAIGLFWEQGFEATGIAQLSDHLGLGRQSLYSTFGDKRSLYLEAIQRYSDESVGWLRTTLLGSDHAIEGIHAVLDTWVANAHDADYCGCFMTNTISELGLRDEDLAKLLKAKLARMTDAFSEAIAKAQEQGDIAAETDANDMARLIVITAQGISTTGKIDPDYADHAIGQLKKSL